MALINFKNLKQKKKDTILKAVVDSLAVRDYDELSINDIAKAADISRGSFYNYFEDKYDAVYTLVVSKFELLKDTFKKTIIDCKGDLFEGALSTYKQINEILKNEIDFVVVKNIKFYMGIVTKIVYSKGYETELDELLDWLLENTNEGKEKLNSRKKMANVLELLISLFLNTTARVITDVDCNRKYDDFNYKLNIIKKGIV